MATILVVEDSSSAREVVLRLLTRQGYTAIPASCAAEALHILQQTTPNLMLLDVMMPEMDGLALLQHLRGQPAYKDLPVIMMTALSDDTRRARANELGVKAYLVKSLFSLDELIYHIELNTPHTNPLAH